MSLHNFYLCTRTTVQIHLKKWGFGAIIHPSAHFGANPTGPCRPGPWLSSHPSAGAASSAWAAQCQQDEVEVERQSGPGWDLIQVQSQCNGVSLSTWVMDCEAVASPRSPEPSDCSHLGLISILFNSNPDIKWQSFLSLLPALPPSPRYVNNQTHFVWPCFIDFLSRCL